MNAKEHDRKLLEQYHQETSELPFYANGQPTARYCKWLEGKLSKLSKITEEKIVEILIKELSRRIHESNRIYDTLGFYKTTSKAILNLLKEE